MSDDLRWSLAVQAAALLAVDPRLGGAVLRGPASPARDAWLSALRAALPPGAPWRRMPPQVAEGRLIGGLDLAATLSAGRPVAERGLLAESSGGALIVPMAERLAATAAGHLAAVLDTGELIVERDGIAGRTATLFSAILLDEGIDDERVPDALAERVAFKLDLDGLRPPPPCGEGLGVGVDAARQTSNRESRPGSPPLTPPYKGEGGGQHSSFDDEALVVARARLDFVEASDAIIEALAVAGLAFGVPSLRLATFALRAAKAAAALAGRERVEAEDAELAAALVIAPRATILPAQDEDEAQEPEPPAPPDGEPPPETDMPPDPGEAQTIADSVVEATRAAIPANLLAALGAAAGAQRQGATGGRAGAPRQAAKRGRPAGVRRGLPGHGMRLAIVETLRAAAPWQPLRRSAAEKPSANIGRDEAGDFPSPLRGGARGGGRRVRSGQSMKHGPTPTPDPSPQGGGEARRILVRREDFRVGRFKERSETLTIFVVDASGSAALHRLAEVKGAVELILADCYVRRDSVALIAFRGERAELILPPTRSLARAKRALAGQPGGGGTPLAAAIDAATLLAQVSARKGQTPLVVLLTDGKANIARTGLPGRAAAEADAATAAQAFRLGGTSGLVLDIAPRPGEAAARLAVAMGARYIPLPYADALVMSRAVLAAGSAA